MYKTVKRFLDVICSGGMIIILSPIIFCVAVLVRIFLGSPVLFKQSRPGQHEKIFTLYKFRTMMDSLDEGGKQKTDAERMTAFGRFLRSTSLDELPELINVFKGDMSMVGPRPLLVKYLQLYTPEQRRRHSVRPGLTNISAVTGRNHQSWECKLLKDIWYVDHMSFRLDLKIFLKTIIVVLKREGITDSGGVSRTEFNGEVQQSNEGEYKDFGDFGLFKRK